MHRIIRKTALIAALAIPATLAAAAPVRAAVSIATVYDFCKARSCADGSNDFIDLGNTPLLRDAASENFYGMTPTGGKAGSGTIFELSFDPESGTWTRWTIFSFAKHGKVIQGVNPSGPLIADAHGNLYGSTHFGGTSAIGGGVVFKLSLDADRGKWKFRTLYAFCAHDQACPDGKWPMSSGVTYAGAASGAPYDGHSPLYGTTAKGGAHDEGVLFSLVPGTNKEPWTETVLHDFCANLDVNICLDGGEPSEPLTMDSQGRLFGTAPMGEDNVGLVYQFDTNGAGYTILHNFCGGCGDGAFPKGGLLLDATGTLIGTASGGGEHFGGVIFKLVPGGENSQVTVLYAFCSENDCTDGREPHAAITMDAAGNIYGTTKFGGANKVDQIGAGGGTVFKFGRRGFKTLYQFCAAADCADGEYPLAAVALDQQGDLLGTTSKGGAHGAGNIFEITP